MKLSARPFRWPFVHLCGTWLWLTVDDVWFCADILILLCFNVLRQTLAVKKRRGPQSTNVKPIARSWQLSAAIVDRCAKTSERPHARRGE